jgi:hypothetical protein
LGTILNDSLYAVPETDLRAIHRITVDRLSVEARWLDPIDVLGGGNGPIEDDIFLVSGHIIDIARQGKLLLTLESEHEPWPVYTALHERDYAGQSTRFRVAAYHNGELVGAFEPRVNGIPLTPTSLDACDTEIIVGVPAQQGGAVVFEGGTIQGWQQLTPVAWQDPDQTVFATMLAGWDDIRPIVKLKNRRVEALLANCELVLVHGTNLVVNAAHSFHVRKLNGASHRLIVEKAIEEVTNHSLTLWIQLRGSNLEWPASIGHEPLTVNLIERLWDDILTEVRFTDTSAAAWLSTTSGIRVQNRTLEIMIPHCPSDLMVAMAVVEQSVLRVTNARAHVRGYDSLRVASRPYDDDNEDFYEEPF